MGRLEVIGPGIHHISLRSWLSLLSHVAPVPLSWDTESDISLPFSFSSPQTHQCLFLPFVCVFTSRCLFFFFNLLITRSDCAHTSGCLVVSRTQRRLLHRCNCTLLIWSTPQTCTQLETWNHTRYCLVILKLQANLEHFSGSSCVPWIDQWWHLTV